MEKRTANKAWYLVPAILQANPKLVDLPMQAANRAVRLAEALDTEINRACDASDNQITRMAETIAKQQKEIDSLRLQIAKSREQRSDKVVPKRAE